MNGKIQRGTKFDGETLNAVATALRLLSRKNGGVR